MKTKLISFSMIAFLLLPLADLQAQFRYGVHAGINFSTQSELGELWSNAVVFPGFSAGAIAEYRLARHVSLQGELNYQQKGSRFDSKINGTDVKDSKYFGYLSVPVMIKGTLPATDGEDRKWNLTGFAGTYASYLTSARSKLTVSEVTTSTSINDQVEKGDWGIIFGGGVNWNLRDGHALVTDIRYEMGLGKIDKQNNDIRNKVIGINIGYIF
ncbi:MAG: porin family protein [Bacteroidales bacterium]